MNTRRMRTGFRKYLLYGVLAGLGLMVSTGLALAQNTLSAGDVKASAGQGAAVPITISTGSNNVAFFAATFKVVPQGGAPAITEKLTYQAATGVSAPDLQTAVQAQAKLAIGYAGASINPALTGMALAGTLMVPVPAGAAGAYRVQIERISAGDSSGNRITLTGQPGTIAVK
ncbi:MAG: hypothetical protein ABSA52_04755 [Candidatus Binatia bacterium]|jgi:hypothetical protein